MKNVFKALTVLITLFSLTGCGLKGPLYFPPADKNAPPPTKTGRDANAIHGAG
ncbi:putative lipoprotein [Escherichia coli]|uniref:LPS-assembly lipoprotein LptM n=1 Tax=Escherichia coli TaxID=562 RepID=A0A2X3KL49_ECOLX|nr:putative lipoprotein [Escherichia coli]